MTKSGQTQDSTVAAPGIVVVGGGNVAQALACGLSRAGVPPVQVWARCEEEAQRVAELASGASGIETAAVAWASEPDKLSQADLYVIAISDKAIRGLRLDFGDAVVAHTAGGVSIDALAARHRAVLYPLQTFSRGREVDWRTVPLLIEGSDFKSLGVVRQVAEMLSGDVREVSSERRMMLHAAGVFVNNFANHMYAAGEELAREAGFDFEILKPLIRETADKALTARSPRDVQTGPAVRNDFETRSRHTELLAQKPYLCNLYVNISNNIWETSKKI